MYRTQRNYENVQRMLFNGIGEYDIPQIESIQFNNAEFIGFNYARSAKNPEDKAVHFFLDDYQFNRVWTDADRYIPMLQRFKYVLTPDFSLYTDFPKALQIYNHYRKHWLGAYWQMHGINVLNGVSMENLHKVLLQYLPLEHKTIRKRNNVFWMAIMRWWSGYSLHRLSFMAEYQMNARKILYT